MIVWIPLKKEQSRKLWCSEKELKKAYKKFCSKIVITRSYSIGTRSRNGSMSMGSYSTIRSKDPKYYIYSSMEETIMNEILQNDKYPKQFLIYLMKINDQS